MNNFPGVEEFRTSHDVSVQSQGMQVSQMHRGIKQTYVFSIVSTSPSDFHFAFRFTLIDRPVQQLVKQNVIDGIVIRRLDHVSHGTPFMNDVVGIAFFTISESELGGVMV
jgi:hypothetical protein